jgi:hypothetical protein
MTVSTSSGTDIGVVGGITGLAVGAAAIGGVGVTGGIDGTGIDPG